IVTTGGTLTGGISYGVDSLIASWVTAGPAASIEANLGSGVLYTSFGGTVTLTANSTPGIVTVSIYRGSVLLGSTTVEFRPNNAPEGVDIDATTAAGTLVFIDVLGGVTDADGDVVSIDEVTQGANGTVTISGGEVVYTPAPGFSGTDTFTVTVVDIHGGTLTLTVTVEVTNQAPVGDDIEASTTAGAPVTIDVLGGVTDPEGDDVSIGAVTQGTNGAVTISGSDVIYTPAPGFSGTDTFTVTVVDELGAELVLTVTVEVNGNPVGGDVSVTTSTGTPVSVDVLGDISDPDGDTVSIDSTTQGANGTVTVSGGEVTYTPAPGFVGTDSFAVTVTDGNGGTLTITITVEVNGGPVGDDIDASTAAGTPVTIDVLGGVTDPNGDDVTIDSVTQGTNGTVTISGGNVVYTPAPGFSGTDTFTVTVVDEHGSELVLTVTVLVTNAAPVGDDIEAATQGSTPVTIEVLAGVTDPDGDDLEVDVVTQGANGSVTTDGTEVTYTPDAGFSGTDTFNVTITDGNGGTLTITVSVLVNGNPVGSDASASTQAETPVSIDILGSITDPDGDDVEIASVTQGANGSVTIAGGEVVYTPAPGFSGTDSFTVTVQDENGGSLTITVTVTVNGAPEGDDIEAATDAGTPVTVDVLGGVTDPEGGSVAIESVTQGANGSVTISSGEVVYTPAPGFAGTDSFTVTVEDEDGGTVTLTVTVLVNGNPVGDDIDAVTQAGTPVSIDVLAGVTDPNGDVVTIDSVTQGANGSVTISGGEVVYTPAPGFS
ncbi:MAG: Ig-like domain-containing protein, partial [Dehalococcoidia bacterium]|nr:Ig-like domain-containing protein [Dehalococcoidia bacterium]